MAAVDADSSDDAYSTCESSLADAQRDWALALAGAAQTRLGARQQALAKEGQAILRKVGIDPFYGKENLVWAPLRATNQHHIDSLRPVVDQLRKLDRAGADYDDFVRELQKLGQAAARGGK